MKIAPLPPWIIKKLKKAKISTAVPVVALTGKQLARGKAYAERALEREAMRVRNAPFHTRNDTLNRASFRIGQLLAHRLVGEAEVMRLLTEAALKCGLEAIGSAKTIQSGIDGGLKSPRRLPTDFIADPPAKMGSANEITRELAKLGQTDADNAERFIRRYAHRVLWTKAQGWAVYDGIRWKTDEENSRLTLAVEAMKLIKDEAEYVFYKKAETQTAKIRSGVAQ